MKTFIKIFSYSFAFLSFMLISINAYSQKDQISEPDNYWFDFEGLYSEAAPGPDSDFTNTAGSENDVPIDGGLGFLLAAGVGYAVKGMRKNQKSKMRDGTKNRETCN